MQIRAKILLLLFIAIGFLSDTGTADLLNLGFGNLGFGNIGLGNIGFWNIGKFNVGRSNLGRFNILSVKTIGKFNIGKSHKIGLFGFGVPNLLPFGRKK